MLSSKSGVIVGVSFFVFLWLVLFLYHEFHSSNLDPSAIHGQANTLQDPLLRVRSTPAIVETAAPVAPKEEKTGQSGLIRFDKKDLESVIDHAHKVAEEHDDAKEEVLSANNKESKPTTDRESEQSDSELVKAISADVDAKTETDKDTSQWLDSSLYRHGAKRGQLVCNGKPLDSEVIYWKVVPGDADYESPITPHHEQHLDRYITFEYDNGGWNNVRMGVESVIVVAHAMGRTLVIPPQQHLYLLGATHKDPNDTKAHDEMGFEDFFDIELLRSHRGFHVMHMEDFLEKEAVTGGLHGILPPKNSSEIWGSPLWRYLNKVADQKPAWMGRFIAFPASKDDFATHKSLSEENVAKRLKAFAGDRSPVFYDEQLMKAHHIHFPGNENHRLLQHHYAFAFFADQKMQSFYRRFVRDYMRYKDNIQCAGAELVAAVRKDAMKLAPDQHGEYYALHIRRGDFQFKEVKISAQEIVDNLHFKNGTPIIPPGSVVYISTDDPDGKCVNCFVQRKPCTSYETPKPVGCPEDTSWNAFEKFGWKIRFLRDYLKAGYLKDVNPNTHGMLESIVCSRAKAFAGTYFSTFTGYIHRLRGYHGLGEATYYHHKHYVFYLQKEKSVGHGFSREWRSGWTDDEGQLI